MRETDWLACVSWPNQSSLQELVDLARAHDPTRLTVLKVATDLLLSTRGFGVRIPGLVNREAVKHARFNNATVAVALVALGGRPAAPAWRWGILRHSPCRWLDTTGACLLSMGWRLRLWQRDAGGPAALRDPCRHRLQPLISFSGICIRRGCLVPSAAPSTTTRTR